MAKLMAPNIRIDWYPEGHFADIQNPTVAELNSGYNLSCAIVTGYTLDFTDSNTEDTTTIFDDFTSESILNHSYEADLQFFLAPRDSIAGNEEAYRKAEELFYVDQNPKGYLAKRFGFPGDSKYVGNQKVDLFLLQADLPKVLSEEDNPVLLNIRFLPQGEAVSGVTVIGQLIKVTAVGPTWKDSSNLYLKGGGTWSTPAVEGVIYDRPSGTAKGGETVTVSARPKTGYEIAGSTSWSHTFPERLPWVSYEWEGEPHNSPSIKRDHTGQIVARNYVNNPSYADDFLGWEFMDSDVSKVSGDGLFQDLDGGVGDSVAKVVRTSSGNATIRDNLIDIPGGSKYAAISIPGQGENMRVWLYYENASGGTLGFSQTVPQSFESGGLIIYSTEIPDDTTRIRLYIGVLSASSLDHAYFGNPILSVADSESEALAQVAEYFDGDTPDEYL